MDIRADGFEALRKKYEEQQRATAFEQDLAKVAQMAPDPNKPVFNTELRRWETKTMWFDNATQQWMKKDAHREGPGPVKSSPLAGQGSPSQLTKKQTWALRILVVCAIITTVAFLGVAAYYFLVLK